MGFHGRLASQCGVEEDGRDAIGLDRDHAGVGLEHYCVVGDAIEEAGKLVAVVQQQPVGVVGGAGV
jgi:hypothetical protein